MVRVFISHSSGDKGVVEEFVDNVVCGALGLRRGEVAFTSSEASGVEPGDDIIQYLRENIAGAEAVLLMISANFKGSEVCLNEMGAAWATAKHIIPILLPGTDFDSLGWLNSFRKAIRIDDSASLDSLYVKMCGLLGAAQDVKSWNLYKEKFLAALGQSKATDNASSIPTMEALPAVIASSVSADTAEAKGSAQRGLEIFDSSLQMRCVTEGEFQMQLQFRLRAGKEDVYLREVALVNEEAFTGNMGDVRSGLKLLKFTEWGKLEIAHETIDGFYKRGKDLYKSTAAVKIMDLCIKAGEQKSMAFHDGVMSTRMPDGYEDMPRRGWSVRVAYNRDSVAVFPLQLSIVGKEQGYFGH